MPRAKAIRHTIICEVCGDSFEVVACKCSRRFCSRRCYSASKTTPVAERFKRYVGETTDTGCIPWTGTVNKKGYGLIGRGGRNGGMMFATHVAWESVNGPIPTGLHLLHRCDNPPCVNVGHLFLGTAKENSEDMVRKGRSPQGSARPMAKLTDELVRQIRTRFDAGGITQSQLAKDYSMSIGQICEIVRRKAWKHVP